MHSVYYKKIQILCALKVFGLEKGWHPGNVTSVLNYDSQHSLFHLRGWGVRGGKIPCDNEQQPRRSITCGLPGTHPAKPKLKLGKKNREGDSNIAGGENRNPSIPFNDILQWLQY